MVEAKRQNQYQLKGSELIQSILEHHLDEGDAFSLWRLPGTTKKNILICEDGGKSIEDIAIEESVPGFVVSSFDDSKKIFLKGDLIFEIDKEIRLLSSTRDNAVIKEFNQSPQKRKINFHFGNTSFVPQDKKKYVELISKSIQEIQSGVVEKLVPSRCRQIDLPDTFNLIDAFDQLCDLYPNAFISLVSSVHSGTWLGASPELLASVDNEMKFKTVAVAGTQVYHDNCDLKQIAWTQKEIEEQALVSRYIINCFKKIRLREFDEHGPKTWKAGNLLHLKTDFEVDMAATNFPQLGSVMLKLLHPTSAVCGMPREESLAFLKEHEGFNREFYSGFLGPVNIDRETNIFVNLRCMQWQNDKAVLYAGAGVTLDSSPEKEWEETEMKMKTLLRVIEQ